VRCAGYVRLCGAQHWFCLALSGIGNAKFRRGVDVCRIGEAGSDNALARRRTERLRQSYVGQSNGKAGWRCVMRGRSVVMSGAAKALSGAVSLW